MRTSGYKTPRKNHWRRMTWNEISRRTKNRKYAQVMYLAGEENLDPGIADGKGFNPKNFVPVENDRRALKALRAAGTNVVNATLSEAVFSFGEKIDVLHADYCCAINDEIASLISAITWSPSIQPGTTVCVNLQRGRDQKKYMDHILRLQDWIATGWGEDADKKHRGLLFMFMLYDKMMSIMPHDEEDRPALLNLINRSFAPKYTSYKSDKSSRGLRMDTVVFTWPEFSKDYGVGDCIKNMEKHDKDIGSKLKKARRHIAAFKAHRTRCN